MELQDILPITSIIFMALGFFIIVVGVIWLATQNTGSHYIEAPTSKDIKAHVNNDLYTLQNQYYEQVIKYKSQGKSSEEIAKELKIGKGEVNLILGIDQMR